MGRKRLNTKSGIFKEGNQSISKDSTPINSNENKKRNNAIHRTSSQPSLPSTSSQANLKKPSTKSSLNVVQTPNKLSAIASGDDDPQEMDHADVDLTHKPPPIQVRGISNFIDFCKKLEKLVGATAFSCRSRVDITTISPNTSDAYRGIIKFLQASGLQYYTYQLKEEKSFRVVIRHLHPSTPEAEIKKALDKLGFKVRQATCVLQNKTKIPLPLFFVDLEPATNNQEIFSLKRLLYTIIVVEEPHRKETIVQCQKCQGFNHSKNFCQLTAACVKCAGPHLTSECTKKTRDEKAKCVHCQGDHPANYKGCSIYQELLRQRRTSRQRLNLPDQQPVPRQQRSHQRVQDPEMMSASQLRPTAITVSSQSQPSSGTNQPQPAATPCTSTSTYASVVNSYPPSSSESFPQAFTTPLNELTSVTSSLSSFLIELRSIISPLILLIQKLCPVSMPLAQT